MRSPAYTLRTFMVAREVQNVRCLRHVDGTGHAVCSLAQACLPWSLTAAVLASVLLRSRNAHLPVDS